MGPYTRAFLASRKKKQASLSSAQKLMRFLRLGRRKVLQSKQGGPARYASDPDGKALMEATGFGKAVGVGGGGLGALAGMHTAGSALNRAEEKRNAKGGWRRAIRENPDLKKMDRKTLKRHFRSLAKFAPSMAADPTAAATFLRMSGARADIGLDPSTIRSLAEIQERHVKGKSQKGGSLAASIMSAAGGIGLGG